MSEAIIIFVVWLASGFIYQYFVADICDEYGRITLRARVYECVRVLDTLDD